MQNEIKKCLDVLRNGGIILYPTDTIWGIGCDATNKDAVQKIYNIKKRQESKALITLVNNEVMLERTVVDMPEIAWDLIESADKPLSIIYEKVKGIAPNVIAENGSCAIRLVKNEFCNKLIYQLKKPIVSTSANVSGKDSPIDFYHIDKEIIDGVDYVVDYYREDKKAKSSSNIIELKNNGSIKIIR
jgi:L-threonylcarbamoyladenylate synthase